MLIILSYYYTIILSYYRTIILSYYHTIILSYYHTIILSYYHIQLSYHTSPPPGGLASMYSLFIRFTASRRTRPSSLRSLRNIPPPSSSTWWDTTTTSSSRGAAAAAAAEAAVTPRESVQKVNKLGQDDRCVHAPIIRYAMPPSRLHDRCISRNISIYWFKIYWYFLRLIPTNIDQCRFVVTPGIDFYDLQIQSTHVWFPDKLQQPFFAPSMYPVGMVRRWSMGCRYIWHTLEYRNRFDLWFIGTLICELLIYRCTKYRCSTLISYLHDMIWHEMIHFGPTNAHTWSASQTCPYIAVFTGLVSKIVRFLFFKADRTPNIAQEAVRRGGSYELHTNLMITIITGMSSTVQEESKSYSICKSNAACIGG